MDAENHNKMLILLSDATNKFAEAAEALDQVLEPICHGMRDADIAQKARLYQQLEYIMDTAKELSRQCNVQQPSIAENITKHLENSGMDSVSVDGYKYTPTIKTYVNVTAENKPTVIQWLKALSSESRELVREDYNANSFASFIKERAERGEEVPPFVNTFDKPALSVRKVKK